MARPTTLIFPALTKFGEFWMKVLVKVLILRGIFKVHESNKWYIVLDELSDVFMAQENFKLRVGHKASYLLFPAKPQNVLVMFIFQSYVLFFTKANNLGIQ